MPDIDIDVADRNQAVAALPTAVPACQIHNGLIMPHGSGVYLQRIPVNPLNNWAAFPYKHAEGLGFIKLDLLNNAVYQNIESQDHLRRLMEEPINWEWFKNVDFVSRLFHFHDMAPTVVQYEPRSILDLACMMAIKLPTKKYLVGQSWEVIREKIWIKEHGEAKQFKKGHAVAYALVAAVDARVKAPQFFDTIAL